jgi:hypothetical protein
MMQEDDIQALRIAVEKAYGFPVPIIGLTRAGWMLPSPLSGLQIMASRLTCTWEPAAILGGGSPSF